MQVLPPGQWRQAAEAHRAAAEQRTAAHRERRARGQAHPVWDFLFTYYPFSPAKLAQWHPGAGVALLEAPEYADRKFYRTVATEHGPAATLDEEAFLAARGAGLGFTLELLERTGARRAEFGCFGMHEWAMVYRTSPDEVRHGAAGLRLGHDGTDEVVESHRIRCSHFDAFRFFTPEAAPRNELSPSREGMRSMEQPGCLHAGMDLYKWAMKLSPAAPSSLVLDCFDLACDIRELDMRASPYDLRDWGFEPVPVETPEGKAEYVAAQRGFSERGQELRARLRQALAPLGRVSSGHAAPGRPRART